MENTFTEKYFEDIVSKEFKSFESKVTAEPLTIAVIGKVSSGKSSFLNAFFDCPKDKPRFISGAESGVTTSNKPIYIGDFIKIIDTPGLSDIKESNSQETKNLLEKGIDIGILIIEGSADVTQKDIYEELKKKSKYVFIVFNKFDIHSKRNLENLKKQWSDVLNISKDQIIYTVSSRGYDPHDRIVDPISGDEIDIPVDDLGRPKTLKNIIEFREVVIDKCVELGKDLYLLKEIEDKSVGATFIILTACISVGVAAFLPGSTFSISGIQATAIASLNYLYTGEHITKSAAISIIPIFITQSIGTSLFVLFKSFLPPTGILDSVAAVMSLNITLAMLVTIANFLKNKIKIEKGEKLNKMFNQLKDEIKLTLQSASLSDFKDKNFWNRIIKKYL